MAGNQSTRIPNVPIRTPMYDDKGNLTRTWVIFFERLAALRESTTTVGDAIVDTDTDLYHRTLLVKDSTVGDDIADHVTVYAPGIPTRIVGVLRKEIENDLTVRVRLKKAVQTNPTGYSQLVVCRIPAGSDINTPVVVTDVKFEIKEFFEGDIFIWDIVSSDGQIDVNGVASFTLAWKWKKA